MAVGKIKTLEERKEELLVLGSEKGYITFEQLADALKGLEIDNDSLDELYTYFVEKCNDGNRVYLRRPANLHNGFDFLVCVEGYNFSEEGKRMMKELSPYCDKLRIIGSFPHEKKL